jgi:hypothetical protein
LKALIHSAQTPKQSRRGHIPSGSALV